MDLMRFFKRQNKNKELIVIDGMDRAGKDTCLNELYNIIDHNKEYCYFTVVKKRCDYRNKKAFRKVLKRFLKKQKRDIEKLFKKYDRIYIARLDMSDNVFSELFNRERIAEKIFKSLHYKYSISYYILLFKSYNEYIKRLNMINETEVQYNKAEFNKIKKLFEKGSSLYKGKAAIYYVTSNTNKNSLVKNILNFKGI